MNLFCLQGFTPSHGDPRKPPSVHASAARSMKCGDAPPSCPRPRKHTFLRTVAGGLQRTGELGRHVPGRVPARREPTQGHVWDAFCSWEHVGHMTGWDALSIATHRNLKLNCWVTCRCEGPGDCGLRVLKAECDHCLYSRTPAPWLTLALPCHPLLDPSGHFQKTIDWPAPPSPQTYAKCIPSVLGLHLLSEPLSLSKPSIPKAPLMDPPGVTRPLETLNLRQPLCFL